MSYELLGIVTLLALILIGVGFGFWFYRRKSPLQRELLKLARAVGHAEFVDALLPDGMGGEIHIERLLLTNRGFLLLDTRDVQGMVFAGERMQEWSAIDQGRRVAFDNPIPGLLDRLAALRALAPGVPVEGRIVFHSSVSFPKGHPEQVTTAAALTDSHVRDGNAESVFSEQWEVLTQLVKK